MKKLLLAELLAMGVSASAWAQQQALPIGSASSHTTYQGHPEPNDLTLRREATTLKRHTAVRLPDEADTTFVQRVLPHAYAGHDTHLLVYAWRPSHYGRQLFFSRRSDDGYGGTDLFILDPYQPATYTVQVLKLDNGGDLDNYLAAVFFADVNHDSQLELLALVTDYVSEDDKESGARGHANHYHTDVWRYGRSGPDGRPHYWQDAAPRRYLDELPTAAAVRRALGTHQPHEGLRSNRR
jgi:hypothetical protein